MMKIKNILFFSVWVFMALYSFMIVKSSYTYESCSDGGSNAVPTTIIKTINH